MAGETMETHRCCYEKRNYERAALSKRTGPLVLSSQTGTDQLFYEELEHE
jgi:hypothetical protein